MRARAMFVALVLASVPACSSDESATTAPGAQLPPEVVSVEPEARATRVWYDTSIWADFATALDPTTVTDRTVFLKQDTQRMSSRISYDAHLKRIVIEPQVPLPLDRTLTVELSTSIRTAEGGSFGGTYFWQFKTNSLRRLERVGPEGTAYESPSTPVLWAGTEATAGVVHYDLYSGTDSTQVALRTGTPKTVTRPYWLPSPKWPEGSRMFWSIRARNLGSGEVLDGPVWSFETVPAGTPVDSIQVPLSWWGQLLKRTNGLTCNGSSVTTSSDVITAIKWGFEAAPQGIRLQSVRMYAQSLTTLASTRFPTLSPSQAAMPFCDIQNPGPPFIDTGQSTIIAGADGANPVRLHWESDYFTAHVQAAITYGGFYGYVMTSSGVVNYSAPALTLIYYRLPPAPAARVATR